MDIQESGCNLQPRQTSDPSYITAKVILNPNRPRFISKVSLLVNMTMPHSLPASFEAFSGAWTRWPPGAPLPSEIKL